ncbi:MAG: glycine zipper 2TM domain-containing protein [Ramlibacter sp.]|nr:glycine zipper 2TM domain-containing protein [Ramlibacter sp.]
MRTSLRVASIASCGALAAMLAACGANPTLPASAPVATYPATYPAASLEYGRVTNIEYFPGGPVAGGINVPGAIVGGVAGAVVGDALSGGRSAATVLGGAAGAAIGSQVGRTQAPAAAVYRVTLRTDAGIVRTYDVPTTGDLRIGDRVRVESGVIYRS